MGDFRRDAHAIVDQLADYLESAQRGEGRAIPYEEPAAQYGYWRDWSGDLPQLVADVLARSTAVHHPGYTGHQVAVPSVDAVLAGWVSELLNNGSAVYEMGMANLALERRCTEELCAAFGLPAGAGGVLTSGGSLANLTAMLAARAAQAPQAEASSLCVLASDQAHYCIDRAARIMGWGAEGVVPLRTDPAYRVSEVAALEEGLAEARRRGRRPVAVVGMACTTSTGSYDDLALLANFAAREALWLHVDAAHGGAARFRASEAHLVAGIERADSITLDAHKMMRVPALTTALLYARGGDGFRAFAQRADYLWADDEGEWYHGGQRTVECTKLMLGLRLFAQLRDGGLARVGAYVAGQHALARAFAKTLAARPDWELACAPQSNIVCFRHRPPHLTEPGASDAHNVELRERLLRDGRYYVVSTRLRGVYWLRVTLMHPGTDAAALVAWLREQAAATPSSV